MVKVPVKKAMKAKAKLIDKLISKQPKDKKMKKK